MKKLIATTSVALGAGTAESRSATEQMPNILFILTDDMGYALPVTFGGKDGALMLHIPLAHSDT